MTTATQLTIAVKQGEVLDIPLNIKANNVAKDLTGATIKVEVKKVPLVSQEAIVSKEITETSDINTIGQITSPSAGRFQIHLDDTDTGYAPQDYYLIIWLILDGQEDIISSTGNNWAIYRICKQ